MRRYICGKSISYEDHPCHCHYLLEEVDKKLMVDFIITMPLPFPMVPARLSCNSIPSSYSCTLHEAATANTALNLLILVCRLLSMASSENLVLHARTERQQDFSPLLSVTTRPLREKILQMTFRPLEIVTEQSIAIRYLTASVLQEFV